MFTQEESQHILNELNEGAKRTGLEKAAISLVIISKLQASFQAAQAKAKELPVVPAEEVEAPVPAQAPAAPTVEAAEAD